MHAHETSSNLTDGARLWARPGMSHTPQLNACKVPRGDAGPDETHEVGKANASQGWQRFPQGIMAHSQHSMHFKFVTRKARTLRRPMSAGKKPFLSSFSSVEEMSSKDSRLRTADSTTPCSSQCIKQPALHSVSNKPHFWERKGRTHVTENHCE